MGVADGTGGSHIETERADSFLQKIKEHRKNFIWVFKFFPGSFVTSALNNDSNDDNKNDNNDDNNSDNDNDHGNHGNSRDNSGISLRRGCAILSSSSVGRALSTLTAA